MFRSLLMSVPAIPVLLDRRTGKPLHRGESRRPTVPRPQVRCDLFSGWGPKL